MVQKFELNATMRDVKGKGASRRLRRLADMVPAIIYGGNKEPVMISLAHNHVIHALENTAIYSSIITLAVDNKKEPVVMKDLQRHPFKPKVLHIDFKRIKADEAIEILVPLHFVGEEEAPGIKVGGGAISYHMKEVEVSCLPASLPETIEIDVSKLELNDSIHLSNLKLPKNVELATEIKDSDSDAPIVSIDALRTAEEPETTAAAAAPETEITKAKNKEEAEANKK